MLLNYLVILFGGSILMFLFIKFFEKRYIYFIAWVVLFLVLGALEVELWGLEDLQLYFEEQFQYDNWFHYVALAVVAIPALYVAYPVVILYFYIFKFFMEVLDVIREMVEYFIHLPVKKQRIIDYYKKRGMFEESESTKLMLGRDRPE